MLKKLLLLIILLAVAIIGAAATIKNSQPVLLDYYFGSLNLPLVAYLFMAFAAGVIISALPLWWLLFNRNRQIKRLRKSLQAGSTTN